MKIKVSEATELQLDWLVARAQGREEIKVFSPCRPNDRGWVEVRFNPDRRVGTSRFDPSDNWFFGGPIIEREKIDLSHCQNGTGNYETMAEIRENSDITCKRIAVAWGKTDLIAAMRCYVASKLGDEVEVPDDLLT